MAAVAGQAWRMTMPDPVKAARRSVTLTSRVLAIPRWQAASIVHTAAMNVCSADPGDPSGKWAWAWRVSGEAYAILQSESRKAETCAN